MERLDFMRKQKESIKDNSKKPEEETIGKLFQLLEPGEMDSRILDEFMKNHHLEELFESYEKLDLSVEMKGRIHALRQMTFLWGANE